MTYQGLAILTLAILGLLACWALWDWLWERKRKQPPK